jgi:thymidylate synthase ThyX
MWEIRKLAYKMFDVIPEVYKFIFEDCIYIGDDFDLS